MAATVWHRTEPREVRPFFHALEAEQALEACGISLFEDEEIIRDNAFDLDEIDFKKLVPVVHLDIADAARWLPKGISKQDLELVLVARNSFLKRSEVVQSVSLEGAVPSKWPLDSDLLQRFAGGRNLHLIIALCLASDRTPEPGSPFVIGHWLASKSFVLRSRTMPTLFDVRTRTDEEWKARGFPPKTFYAVDYSGGINDEPNEGGAIATVWIHQDAHNKMASSALGQTLQPLLAAEIISYVLAESVQELEGVTDVEANSPLATILKQLGTEKKPLRLESLKALVKEPPKLKAALQDQLSVVSALK